MPVYLPTMAMVTLPSGLRMRSLIMPPDRRGRAAALGLDPEGGQHFAVEAGLVIGLRHGIDVVGVARLDHRVLAHIAEQAELAALLARDRPVGAAQQDVGLDADRAQLLHRVLGRLGLELAGAEVMNGSSVRWM